MLQMTQTKNNNSGKQLFLNQIKMYFLINKN